MKQFLFMYPITQYLEFEKDKMNLDKGDSYPEIFNKIIEKRYRTKEFGINFAIFGNTEVDSRIEVKGSDKIIPVGVDLRASDFKYPNPDYIIDQLNLKEIKHLRISGFHVYDCVEKVAKRAYERKMNVLVDEDLTNFFFSRYRNPNFKVDKYPTFNPWDVSDKKEGKIEIRRERESKPWMFQGTQQFL